MKPIIEKISAEKGVTYSEEESSWFNGHMTNPVRTYSLRYNIAKGQIGINGEYRRNTWQNANWYKNLHETDIYIWSVSMLKESNKEAFKISRSSWIEVKLFGKPKVQVRCVDSKLKMILENSEAIQKLIAGKGESVNCQILGEKGKEQFFVWTNFTSQIDHETVIRNSMNAFEEIASYI